MQLVNARRLRRALALASLAIVVPLALAQSPGSAAPAAVPPEDASYSIGLVFGNQLHSAGIGEELSVDAVMRGLKDGLGGKVMSADDRQRAMQMVRAGRDKVAEHNHEVARAFLAKNKDAPGVATTDSGLQYEIIAAGDAKGRSPMPSDRVTVHYRGRLLDGTEFDNSDNHAQAATFAVGSVIKGWGEALQLMKPGAKWRLFVPPQLAYDLNSPPAIPPGSLLIFDMELAKIESPQIMSAPAAAK